MTQSTKEPSREPKPRRCSAVNAFGLVLVLGLFLGAAPLQAEDAWTVIERFRRHLEDRSPFSARFDQTYLPEGFSTGETEGGRFSLSLPECLRWDYGDPYPKSFILCGDVFHYWNADEPEGHRDEIDALSQPGLDLLLLDFSQLRERYLVGSVVDSEGSLEIVLKPVEPNELAVSATLILESSELDLIELSYVDEVGNRTTFRISDYREGLEHGTFNPPEDVEWVEE